MKEDKVDSNKNKLDGATQVVRLVLRGKESTKNSKEQSDDIDSNKNVNDSKNTDNAQNKDGVIRLVLKRKE